MHTDLESTRASIARELASYYSELSGSAAKPAPRFSLQRTLECMSSPDGLTDGYEVEVARATALSAGRRHDPHRVQIPLAALQTRDMTAGGGGGSGGFLVATGTGAPLDVLRPWSVAISAGISVLPNLQGSFVVPRVGTASTAGWVAAEGTQFAASQPVLGQTALVAKTAAVTLAFSRQWYRQSGAGGELLLRQQLLGAIGALLDAAILAGTGASGAPLGIVNTTGIGTQAGASLAHAGILSMRASVLAAGGQEQNLRWVAAPAVQQVLGARERASGGGRFLWDDGRILGAPAHAASTAPAGTLICGDFSKLLLGVWGPPSLTLEVNPYENFRAGTMSARVVLECDVGLPQPAAFAVATSVS